MDPTVIISSFLILFFFEFNINLFGGIGVANILTIPELIDHTSRAISGATMISGLNEIVGQIREAQAAATYLLSSDYEFSDSFQEQQEKQHDNITNDNITVSGEVPSVSEDPFTSGSYSSRNMDEFLENSTATLNSSVIASRYEVPRSRTLEEIALYVWATICALTFPVIIVVLKNVIKLSNQMSELILNDINHHTTSQMRDVHRSLTRQIQGLDMHHIRERIDRLSREVRNYLDETMQSLRPLSALSGKLETIRRSIREKTDTGNYEDQNILDEKLQAIENGNQSIIHQIQEQTAFYDELLKGISRLEEKLKLSVKSPGPPTDDPK
ncbi:hypothetical protein BGW36DRAFT_430671 [Talaromyces proteolyticus]|uniref:Uncharacterized protein n=1 Tax=Talaromyces proteolyticus TaxID=1131652 RepID=A0AAD4KJ98_9EURO|nr:uncharacterized protein BGW36DRAFT_430671 [Talaromyces proteolyticus]KAH8692929.1 hypothetical protein BGW36DRAFT_430671 [Talaromyces proteolyticus]